MKQHLNKSHRCLCVTLMFRNFKFNIPLEDERFCMGVIYGTWYTKSILYFIALYMMIEGSYFMLKCPF